MLLIPVLDMANHSPTAAHELRVDVDGSHSWGSEGSGNSKGQDVNGLDFDQLHVNRPQLVLIAGEDVAAGDEVRVLASGLRT